MARFDEEARSTGARQVAVQRCAESTPATVGTAGASLAMTGQSIGTHATSEDAKAQTTESPVSKGTDAAPTIGQHAVDDEFEWAWDDEEGLAVLAGGLGGILAGGGLGGILGYSGILPGLDAATGAIIGAGLGGILGGLGGDLFYPDDGNNLKVDGGWRVRGYEARHREKLVKLAWDERDRMLNQAMPRKLVALRASGKRDTFTETAINTLETWIEREPGNFETFVPAWDYDESLQESKFWYIASDGHLLNEEQLTGGSYEIGRGKIYLKTINDLVITDDGYEEPVLRSHSKRFDFVSNGRYGPLTANME